MNVYISTVDRTVDSTGQLLPGRRNYLEDTLDSLERSAWVGSANLFFNSPRTGYAGGLPPYVTGEPMSAQEYAFIAEKGVHYRASYNYWRILSHRPGPCVVFEDDIQLADNWYEILIYTINEIERKHDQYVLSLYCCYDSLESTQYSWPYPAKGFYGSQGIFYPKSVRESLANHLLEHGVNHFREPYDLAIKRFCIENGIPMFSHRRSLLQHTAPNDGTGLGGGHQTNTFETRIEHPPLASVYQANSGILSSHDCGYTIEITGEPAVTCNGPAALLWSRCDGETSLADIVREFEREFPEQHEQIVRDVSEAAIELEAAHALKRSRERTRIRSMEISASIEQFCSCNFKGQLGNQLFQIAATLSLAQRHDLVPLFPEWRYRDVFDHALVYVDSPPASGWGVQGARGQVPGDSGSIGSNSRRLFSIRALLRGIHGTKIPDPFYRRHEATSTTASRITRASTRQSPHTTGRLLAHATLPSGIANGLLP
jgi:hypothetical protein